MKKTLKALTTIGGAALAVIGSIFVYRRFFNKKDEPDEAFEDEELFEEDEKDEEDDAEEETFAPAPEEEIFEEDEKEV